MIKGITEKEEKIIKEILKKYPYEFFYYGSRVKGDYTRSSDLDILIKGDDEIPFSVIENLKTEFNESLIPYVVNFSDYNQITPEFYKLIEKDLVRIIIFKQ